jgi:recombinational DNA repair ATPase RecF
MNKMKILSLSIENVRGIREEIKMEPEGKNLVVFGPNGTGKSAVVDAIDFLFTGDISRLAGRGSRGMSLKDHGKHIDADITEASVKATIKMDGIDDPIDIERYMAKPKELIMPDDVDPSFTEALQIAEKGQHVLSRAEILKYIAAEAGKRAEEIQALLNIDKVEEIRKAFVTIHREADRILQTDSSNFEKSKSSVNAVFGIEEFSEDVILAKANECRATLKGEPIDSLDIEKLKEGISPRTKDEKDGVYPEQLKNTIDAAQKHIAEKGEQAHENEKELRATIKKLKYDAKLRRDLSNKKLLDMGISLIDESGSCPLCLTKWEPGTLEEFLKGRLTTAKEAEDIDKKIKELSKAIDQDATVLKGHIETLSATSKKLKLDDIQKDLDSWAKALSDWSEALRDVTEAYPVDDAPEETKVFFSVEKWDDHSKKLSEAAEGLEKASPEQKAWDALTALEHVLKRYFEDKKKWEASVDFSNVAKVLDETYTGTKDQILQNLFTSVNSDFSDYYKYLHGEDEDDFQSELKPDGSKLDLTVDFYGRGKHHPRALHSEGHQDSMGLCLYLALNKKISEGKVKLVILDDVVMSIDAGHRRSVCKLLTKKFPDMQFFITTHNRTWARQLSTDGVVKRKDLVEFRGWSVDSGPKCMDNPDVWDQIKQRIDDNEIPTAAHKLREHLEFFYEGICDSLIAPVGYRTDSRYELGDFLSGAKGRYGTLLKRAKSSANSWNNDEAMEKLIEIETQFKENLTRTQLEQWIINESVHFNKLADSEKDDFLPVVEAFQDFEGHFMCSSCGGRVAVNLIGKNETAVKCPCGKITWNLETKK